MPRAGPIHWELLYGSATKVTAVVVAACMLGSCGEKHDNLKLADQKVCAAQAEHVFVTNGWSLTGAVIRTGNVESSGAYASYYNDRERKCFMELFSHVVDTARLSATNSAVLTDAFEGTPYATYTESWSGSRMRLDECSLTLPNSPPLRCASRSEWNALVQPYIEIGAPSR